MVNSEIFKRFLKNITQTMKHYFLFVFIFPVLISNVRSQGNTVKKMQIGDKCPNIELTNIINYKTTKAKISDFRGKLLILDFWATWCSPCLAAFPKLDSLGKQFPNDLIIMPVTTEDETFVKQFLRKMQHATNLLPHSVTNDLELSVLFKHQTVPHYVWIDKDGIVRAFTRSSEITAQNIKRFLREANSSLSVKIDSNKTVDITSGVFKVGVAEHKADGLAIENVDTEKIFQHSVLTKHISGLHPRAAIQSHRFTALNQSISKLYLEAFGRFTSQFLSLNRLIYETKDSSKYMYIGPHDPEAYRKWSRENTYCYQVEISAAANPSLKFEIMQNDLNNNFGPLFGIRGVLEKRKVNCLALTRIRQDTLFSSKGGERKLEANAYWLKIQNSPVNDLISRFAFLYFQNSPFPPVDETGYFGNIDLEINAKLVDVKAVNKELYKYGLEFRVIEKEIDMVVIKDIK